MTLNAIAMARFSGGTLHINATFTPAVVINITNTPNAKHTKKVIAVSHNPANTHRIAPIVTSTNTCPKAGTNLSDPSASPLALSSNIPPHAVPTKPVNATIPPKTRSA